MEGWWNWTTKETYENSAIVSFTHSTTPYESTYTLKLLFHYRTIIATMEWTREMPSEQSEPQYDVKPCNTALRLNIHIHQHEHTRHWLNH